jgi:hypothetical protein
MRATGTLAFGLAAAAAAALGVVVVNVVNDVAFDERFYQLNANAEGNALTWLSSAAAFAGAVLALLLWACTHERITLLLGAVLAFFSLDDAAQVHEKSGEAFGEALGLPDWSVRLWLVLYLPIVVGAAWLIWRLASTAPRDAGRALRLGLLLAASAFVIEIVGPITKEIAERGVEWPNALRVGIEEGIELAAWILVATGLAILLSEALAQRPSARAGDSDSTTVTGTGSHAVGSPSASRATTQSQ